VVQKYSAVLLDNLTNQSMKESKVYKTYYAFATRKAIPKPKFNHRLKALEDDFLEFKQTNQFAKVVSLIPGIIDTSDDDQDNDDDQGDDDEWTNSDNDGDDFVHPKFSTHDEKDKEEDIFDPSV
nr:hypothetical protein [Tanacetum cinerariifolium]